MEVIGEQRIPNWIRSLFESLDRGDVDGFCSYLTEDVDFVYASEGMTSGLTAVHEFVEGFVEGIESSDHRILEVMSAPHRMVVRGEVKYIKLDGSELIVPFANIFEMKDGKIDRYQVYVDQDL